MIIKLSSPLVSYIYSSLVCWKLLSSRLLSSPLGGCYSLVIFSWKYPRWYPQSYSALLFMVTSPLLFWLWTALLNSCLAGPINLSSHTSLVMSLQNLSIYDIVVILSSTIMNHVLSYNSPLLSSSLYTDPISTYHIVHIVMDSITYQLHVWWQDRSGYS